jgi:hypothetical protein
MTYCIGSARQLRQIDCRGHRASRRSLDGRSPPPVTAMDSRRGRHRPDPRRSRPRRRTPAGSVRAKVSPARPGKGLTRSCALVPDRRGRASGQTKCSATRQPGETVPRRREQGSTSSVSEPLAPSCWRSTRSDSIQGGGGCLDKLLEACAEIQIIPATWTHWSSRTGSCTRCNPYSEYHLTV